MYFPALSNEFKKLLKFLEGKKVAVLGHARPDGDCIGSQVALCRILNQHEVQAVCFNKDPIPRVLKDFVEDTPYAQSNSLPDLDFIAITVDCADIKRLGVKLAEKFPKPFLSIDHHISNTQFAVHNYVVPTACATAYVLAGLFLDNNLTIDATTAQALYIGIATDTGQFSYPGTDAEVFGLCQKLVELGASPSKAANYIFQRETINKLDLNRRFLESLKLEYNNQICIGSLIAQDFKDSGSSPEDSEGFVDLTRSIEGVLVGVYLQEQPEGIKGSLRAKDPKLCLDKFAHSFGGGGHHCAAGFFVENRTLKDFYSELVQKLITHLKYIFS